MTTVDVENGFYRIANALGEALILAPMTALQKNLVHAVVRLTYGFGGTEARLTRAELAQLVGSNPDNGGFKRAFADLLVNGVLRAKGDTISLNKNFAKWGRYTVDEAQLRAAFAPLYHRVPKPKAAAGPALWERLGEQLDEDTRALWHALLPADAKGRASWAGEASAYLAGKNGRVQLPAERFPDVIREAAAANVTAFHGWRKFLETAAKRPAAGASDRPKVAPRPVYWG
jgi:phage replication O-like protein O